MGDRRHGTGDSPLSPGKCLWPSGKGADLPSRSRRVRLPQDTLGDRLTVSHLALTQATEVRVLLPELTRSQGTGVSTDKAS